MMGRIVSAYIMPHPPIIVPEVGKGGELGASDTVNAVKRAAREIRGEKPGTIIVTTPHGPVFQDFIHISTSKRLKGDLGKFGCPKIAADFQNNLAMVDKITAYAKDSGIFAGGLDESISRKYNVPKELDHGALVPLYFIEKEYRDFKLVHISIAGLPFVELYRFGLCIARAVRDMDEDVVFVASGDLSHRLTHDAPYGFSERGLEFDKLFIGSIRDLSVETLMNIDEGLCESAGECGLRSFLMMLGALDGYEVRPEIYSYEGPFGVGYSVAKLQVGTEKPDRNILERLEKKNEIKLKVIRESEDPYVALARNSLEAYVKEGRIIKASAVLPEEMVRDKAGTFVSIKKHGQLRGCIGTTAPTKRSIAEEIIYNAISSGTRDPRFDPVREDELDKLVFSVDVLKEPEPIASMEQLDVIRYGVIVRNSFKSGLLLPNLEGVDTPQKQVEIALQKAGIRHGEDYKMERFEVVRHK